MKLNLLTEKYLTRISDSTSSNELLLDIKKTRHEAIELIKQKGYTLQKYNNETSNLVNFCKDLDFIQDGMTDSWKDDLTNDYCQVYYHSLQQRVEQIIKTNF